MFDSLTSREVALKFLIPTLMHGEVKRIIEEVEIRTKDFYPDAPEKMTQMAFVLKPIFTKHKPKNESEYWRYVIYSDDAIEVFDDKVTVTYIDFDVLERLLKMGRDLGF